MAKNNEEENIIDKKKIEDEITKDLREEVSTMIEIESKKTLEKMEKKILKMKNSSIRKRNLIILILLLACLFEGYIIFTNKYVIKIEDVIIKTEKKEEIKKDDKLDTNKVIKDDKWYMEKYSYLLDNIKLGDIQSLYKKDIKVVSLDSNVKLDMAYSNLNVDKTSDIIKFDEEKLENKYKELFNDEFVATNFDSNGINFIYSSKANEYKAINIDTTEIEKIENINKIYEENDRIIIETTVGFINDGKLVDSNNNIIEDDFEEEKITEYNLESYKYSFIKENDKYYFYKLEKIG